MRSSRRVIVRMSCATLVLGQEVYVIFPGLHLHQRLLHIAVQLGHQLDMIKDEDMRNSESHLQQRLLSFVVQLGDQFKVGRLRLQTDQPQLLPQQHQQRQRQLLLRWSLSACRRG